MTAVAVFTQPSRGAVYMVTDGALYDALSGAIITFENKTAVVENWPGAVTNTGNAEATGLVVDALGGEFPTWDGMVAGADDFLARVVPTWGLQSGADVILAGMSATRGPEAYTFRIDDELPVLATQEEAAASKYWADRPFKFVRLGKLVMAPVPHDQILPANWEGIADDADDAEIEWSMRKLINMQRHMSLPDSIGGIGGFATITKITSEGIEQRTLLEWPEDRTGGRIRPRPINWQKWHRDNPRPGRVVNLPSRKRKRAGRDRRGLTAQRLQMLGDLASVDEKVRLTELSIIQARLQPGSLITDTDVQRIKDYAREQEVLSREQTRIGYLGGAANDFDRYAVRLHELDVAIKYSKIGQDDFNRAVAYANPLFAGVANTLENNLTSGLSSFVSGTKSAKDAFSEMALSIVNEIEKMIIKLLIVRPLIDGLAGVVGKGLTPAPLNIVPFAFANGGIMTAHGPVPLRSYAMGGIADSPQMALFGEGRRPEAYVPLPDGRSIPVKIAGGESAGRAAESGSGTTTVAPVFHIDARGAQKGAGEEIAQTLRAFVNSPAFHVRVIQAVTKARSQRQI